MFDIRNRLETDLIIVYLEPIKKSSLSGVVIRRKYLFRPFLIDHGVYQSIYFLFIFSSCICVCCLVMVLVFQQTAASDSFSSFYSFVYALLLVSLTHESILCDGVELAWCSSWESMVLSRWLNMMISEMAVEIWSWMEKVRSNIVRVGSCLIFSFPWMKYDLYFLPTFDMKRVSWVLTA